MTLETQFATLADLADRAANAIADADAGTWPAATLQEWCVEAIREYSNRFPRTCSTTIDCTTADHSYDLPDDFLNALAVEYPAGQDPPCYLKHLSRKHPAFWGTPGYYDIDPSGQANADGVLYISDSPTTGEDIGLIYLATHDLTIVDTDAVTVPDQHQHVLILYVVWKAQMERLMNQVASPDSTMGILNSLQNAAKKAEFAYTYAMQALETHHTPGGYTGPWRADAYDPIY
jgi:hypothetical protein